MKEKNLAKILAIDGMMICVTAILGLTPIGTIPLVYTEITIAPLPSIVSAMTLGLGHSLVVALSLGIISLIRSATMPMSPLDPFFVNPVVSVLPRIIIPVTAYFVFKGVRKLMNKRRPQNIVSIIAGGAAGSLTNTVLVLLALYIVYFKDLLEMAGALGQTVEYILLSIAAVNGLSEMVVNAVLSCVIVLALQKAKLSWIK